MPIKSDDVTWVEEPEFGLLEAMYLPAIAEGVKTTLKHLFRPQTTTEEYPEVKPTLPLNYRGLHRLNRDDQGRVKCVACFLCATACPARCIEIVGDKAPWADRDKYPTKFVIDELKCIYCGMCEEACPVDAIELTSLYDLTGRSRQGNALRPGKTPGRLRSDDQLGPRPDPHALRSARPGGPDRHHPVPGRRQRVVRASRGPSSPPGTSDASQHNAPPDSLPGGAVELTSRPPRVTAAADFDADL